MTHSMSLTAHVGADQEVTILLPSAVPEGDVELFVIAVPNIASSAIS